MVERMLQEGAPLSRNRHFHSLDNAEGRSALRIVKRLRALQTEILKSAASAEGLEFSRLPDQRIELTLRHMSVRATRVALLDAAEWEILTSVPEISDALKRRADHQAR